MRTGCSAAWLASSSTSCMRSRTTSAAICCRSAWRAWAGWRRPAAASASAPPVAEPTRLTDWLSRDGAGSGVRLIQGKSGARADVSILVSEAHVPWSGHMGVHALPQVYDLICGAGTTIVFVNTRAQAEIVFQELWRLNDNNLAIALHHGSLSAEQRRKVEAAMTRGALRAVVATSSLDLGVDWAAVDPGRPGRRTEGGDPSGPADRPLQPPARPAEPRRPGAGQSLRGAGMPGRRRRHRGRRARRPAAAVRRPRRAGPACARHGLRGAVCGRRAVRRGALCGALCRPRAR